MIFYTNSTAEIKAPAGGVKLAYKKACTAPVLSYASSGFFSFPTGAAPGSFHFQIYDAAGSVIQAGQFEIVQDLEHAGNNYDPRSLAERTLEALEAKIAGRALTIEQTAITVDGRSITYMNSIEELLKWRDHFVHVVAREKGIKQPQAQICVLRKN